MAEDTRRMERLVHRLLQLARIQNVPDEIEDIDVARFLGAGSWSGSLRRRSAPRAGSRRAGEAALERGELPAHLDTVLGRCDRSRGHDALGSRSRARKALIRELLAISLRSVARA